MDNYNYPPGSDTPNAPWNEKEPTFVECEDCKGTGKEPICDDHGDNVDFITCDKCEGSGERQWTHEEEREHEMNVKCMKKHGFVP